MFLSVKESTPNAVLQFSTEDGKLVSKIEVLEDQDYVQVRLADKPLCKGDGVGFAKCVKKALDTNECIKIVHCTYCAYTC